MNYDWGSAKELESKLNDLLDQQHSGYVTRLTVSLDGDTVVLRGEVASEDCRGDAKRLALGFNGVFKVRNELVVAGFLEAATTVGDEDYFGQKSLGSGGGSGRIEGPGVEYASYHGDDDDGQVEVERRPVIEATGVPIPGGWIDLAVDLSSDMRGAERRIALGHFPSDWSSIAISVQVFAPWASDVNTLDPTIEITSDGGSSPSRLRIRAADDYVAGAPAPVHVSFFHGTRVCGHETRDLAGPAIETTPTTGSSEKKPASVRVAPDATGPSVAVTIIGNGDGDQTWTWRALVPGGTSQGSGSISVDGTHKEFAEALLKACPDLKPNEFRRTMRGIGEALWRAAPAEFREAYRLLRTKLGPGFAIQFVTGDPHVPWEMMRPDLAGVDVDHLFLEHPVSRWPLTRAELMRNSLPDGTVLSFAPEYPSHKELPSAQSEGAWIEATFDGIRMPGKREDFLSVLDGKFRGSVGVLHFAGHGRVDTGLMDGGIEFEDDFVNVQEVDNSGIVLGRRDGTLMVLNACEVGSGGKLLGMNSGWGAAIAAREFGGLIAPLWEVQDGVALLMIQSALPPLLDGSCTLGEALMQARRTHGNTSVAAFAYLAHGDVMARFATS